MKEICHLLEDMEDMMEYFKNEKIFAGFPTQLFASANRPNPLNTVRY